MIRHWLPLPVLVLAFACSAPSSSSSASSDTKADASSPGKPGKSAGTGSGHLQLTGDITMDRDFAVDMCQISPAGAGLLSGYHMNAKDGDESIMMLSIVLKDYAKDGTYSPSDKSAEGQVNAAMATGSMGPLTLMVTRKDSPMPVAVMLKPESDLKITISDNGTTGVAEFSRMGSPLSMADIDLKTGTMSKRKVYSGRITWSCADVDRLDPQMNDAVNGAFDKLMPSKEASGSKIKP